MLLINSIVSAASSLEGYSATKDATHQRTSQIKSCCSCRSSHDFTKKGFKKDPFILKKRKRTCTGSVRDPIPYRVEDMTLFFSCTMDSMVITCSQCIFFRRVQSDEEPGPPTGSLMRSNVFSGRDRRRIGCK